MWMLRRSIKVWGKVRNCYIEPGETVILCPVLREWLETFPLYLSDILLYKNACDVVRGQASSVASHYLVSGPTFSPSPPWHPGRSSLLPANISLLSSLIEKVILVRIEFREEQLTQREEQITLYSIIVELIVPHWCFNPDSMLKYLQQNLKYFYKLPLG